MPNNDIDDWEKPRSKGTHLTEDEIAAVKLAFQNGRHIRDVARELKCASRTITKYYGLLRAEGAPQTPTRRKPTVPRSSRFYQSNFEPS